MDCPECNLTNPPTAERCDCGYDFQTARMKEPYLPESEKRLAISVACGMSLLSLVALALGCAVALVAFYAFTVVVPCISNSPLCDS
jgi:hypothetical protein